MTLPTKFWIWTTLRLIFLLSFSRGPLDVDVIEVSAPTLNVLHNVMLKDYSSTIQPKPISLERSEQRIWLYMTPITCIYVCTRLNNSRESCRVNEMSWPVWTCTKGPQPKTPGLNSSAIWQGLTPTSSETSILPTEQAHGLRGNPIKGISGGGWVLWCLLCR